MFNNSDRRQPPQKSLKIQQDDKFFSRLLSKESSMAYPSSRVPYYGGRPGSVPFLWESEPGTPISKSRDESLILLPPLTPPPSYHYYNNSHKNPKNSQKRSKLPSNLLNTLLPKKIMNASLNKKSTTPSPNSFWPPPENSSMLVSLNSSGRTTTSSTAVGSRGRSSTSTSRFSSSSSSSFDWRRDIEEDHEEKDVGASPNSALCFGCYSLR